MKDRRIIAGVIAGAALGSMLFPSPTTIAKFKPWKDPDPAVRVTFFISITAAVGIVAVLLLNGRK